MIREAHHTMIEFATVRAQAFVQAHDASPDLTQYCIVEHGRQVFACQRAGPGHDEATVHAVDIAHSG